MKKIYCLFLSLCILPHSYSQTCADYVVQLSATVQTSPPQIILSWPAVSGATTYNIFKKAKQSSSWGSAIGSVSTTGYTDNSVVVDSAYEYSVQVPGNAAYGYIYAAIKAPAIHNRGTVLLLVDSTFIDSCTADITQLTKDISCDGWRVLRKDFLRTTGQTVIKNYITSIYATNPDLNALLILGHIAVPYSGNYDTTTMLAPDGHKDHAGAWPADSYYGELNGTWTDAVNNVMGTRAANKNTPGDGKWDQSQLPSLMELQVSRIDFANMPAFAKSEVQMMKTYLAKDHSYKIDQLTINHKVLIDDNFGKFSGEGFAATAYRLAPLVGNANIQNQDFVSTLNTTSYQWAMGCGAGSFTDCNGVGSTTDFTTKAVNAVFTIAFGSYFGDWNVQNNFLRAALCSNTPALTSCWSGRPHWYFHHMALGENIGYATITTQNNVNTYSNPVNFYPNFIHPALMGDLTLRTDYIKPPTATTLTAVAGAGASIAWAASPDPLVIGYYVYRSTEEFGTYQIRSGLVTTLSFIDSFGTNGQQFYMVRPVKLQSTPSGSYYNPGLGNTSLPATITYPHSDPPTGIAKAGTAGNIFVYPNPATTELYVNIPAVSPGTASLSIFNQQGQLVSKTNTALNAGNNQLSIPVAQMPAGLYYLNVVTDKGTYTARWIKAGQ